MFFHCFPIWMAGPANTSLTLARSMFVAAAAAGISFRHAPPQPGRGKTAREIRKQGRMEKKKGRQPTTNGFGNEFGRILHAPVTDRPAVCNHNRFRSPRPSGPPRGGALVASLLPGVDFRALDEPLLAKGLRLRLGDCWSWSVVEGNRPPTKNRIFQNLTLREIGPRGPGIPDMLPPEPPAPRSRRFSSMESTYFDPQYPAGPASRLPPA